MTVMAPPVRPVDGDFAHEALLYAGQEEFVEATSAFIREGVAAGEPALVVVSAAKIRRLRDRLGRDAERVHFADMAEVGANPAQIIPAWQDFVSAHAESAARLRGVGEPIWAERSAAELVECERHESLLNVAFEGGRPWRLMCPYDTGALAPAVIEEARRNHPIIRQGSSAQHSSIYRGMAEAAGLFDVPLPDPVGQPAQLVFNLRGLSELRAFVSEQAARAGLNSAQISELVVAVNEVATNSVRHGGGAGTLRMWPEGRALVCEVRDAGVIGDPLAGRARPTRDAGAGRGLWLANRLCDLVQVRCFPTGTVIRLHTPLRARPA